MSKVFWMDDSKLDPEQRYAVEGINESSSFLISGPAGSGKTNILLFRCIFLTYKNLTDFKIIVFTNSLREFLAEGCALYKVNPDSVITQMRFFRNILDEHSVLYNLVNDFEADREMLAGKVMSLIGADKISQDYCTTLLIDEAQDYSDTELRVFRAVTKNLVLATDNRQSIYKTTHTPDLIESLVGNNVVPLSSHYRSGLQLCKVADEILKDSAAFDKVHGHSKYPEVEQPSSVVSVECSDFTEQCETIITSLIGQLDLYPDEKLGVLFPKRDQVSLFQNHLIAAGLPPERVRVDTMHGAKGWEFRAVHLGGCEALNKMGPTQKRLIYTAILRGKTSARIYFTGHLPGYLTAALAVLSPPVPHVPIGAILKGITG